MIYSINSIAPEPLKISLIHEKYQYVLESAFCYNTYAYIIIINILAFMHSIMYAVNRKMNTKTNHSVIKNTILAVGNYYSD